MHKKHKSQLTNKDKQQQNTNSEQRKTQWSKPLSKKTNFKTSTTTTPHNQKSKTRKCRVTTKTKYKQKDHSPTTKNFATPKNLTNINRAKNISINESDLSKIKNGMQVKHSRFGGGKVLRVSGEGSNRKATVFFNGVGQKELLLKFAKLEIIN